MPLTADAMHIAVLSTVDIFAMIVNSLYIFIILHKTPKYLSSYSALLLYIATVDWLASFSSWMCIVRLRNVNNSILLTYIGPCTFVSAKFCHFILAGNVNLVSLSVILLVTSFAYRLWMLKIKKDKMWIWTVTLGLIFALFMINAIAMFLGGTYHVPGQATNLTISIISLRGEATESLLNRFSVMSLLSTNTLGFCVVFFIRRRLFASINRLSPSVRRGHKLIYRSLTAQMLLPLAYIFASQLWFLDFIGLVHSKLVQRSIFFLCSLFAVASPMINLHYIPPYRQYLTSLLGTITITPTFDKSSFTHRSQTKL